MKKKIAFIIPKLEQGGAERVVSNLTIHLSENYENYIILFDETNINYKIRGNLINLNVKAASNPLIKTINLIRRIYKLWRIKRKYEFDTILSFMGSPNIINILTKGKGRVVISVRNYISLSKTGLYGKIYKMMVKILYNKADLITVVSNAIKADLVKHYNLIEDKIKVIYNPCDIKLIKTLSSEPLEEEFLEIFKEQVIINVGRLTRQKGQWHLIRAFKKVKEKLPNAKLVILGEGILKDFLQEIVINYKLENDVVFLGFQHNPFKFISRSDIAVFSSLYEGFPNALAEAMACQIPVISTDCKSGPREILAPGSDIERKARKLEYAQYGLLVPVCDGKYYNAEPLLTKEEELLAESIKELFLSQEKLEYYKINSPKRIKDFSVEKIISEYQEIL